MRGSLVLGGSSGSLRTHRAQTTAGNSSELDHDGAWKTLVFPKYSGEREKLGKGGGLCQRDGLSQWRAKRRLEGSENVK